MSRVRELYYCKCNYILVREEEKHMRRVNIPDSFIAENTTNIGYRYASEITRWTHYSYVLLDTYIPVRVCPKCGETLNTGPFKTLEEMEAELEWEYAQTHPLSEEKIAVVYQHLWDYQVYKRREEEMRTLFPEKYTQQSFSATVGRITIGAGGFVLETKDGTTHDFTGKTKK